MEEKKEEKVMSISEMLSAPFSPRDIEWRISRCGAKNGKPYAFVLAYVTNRAIMERLDAVVGSFNWKNEYCNGPNGGVLCGLSIRHKGEWLTKWDGAENTNIEAVKGGLSDAMKRAAVQWGIGRYLYRLPKQMYANITDLYKGEYYQPKSDNPKNSYPAFSWDSPELPGWARSEI
jgi:hypothetical protein